MFKFKFNIPRVRIQDSWKRVEFWWERKPGLPGKTRLKLGLDQLQVNQHVMVLDVGFVIYELSASLTSQRLELGAFPNGHRSRYPVASHIKLLEKKVSYKEGHPQFWLRSLSNSAHRQSLGDVLDGCWASLAPFPYVTPLQCSDSFFNNKEN